MLRPRRPRMQPRYPLFSVLWAVVGIGWAVRWARKRDLRSVSLTRLETDAG
jgi:hypothetical protein